jgi:hypothetical protein
MAASDFTHRSQAARYERYRRCALTCGRRDRPTTALLPDLLGGEALDTHDKDVFIVTVIEHTDLAVGWSMVMDPLQVVVGPSFSVGTPNGCTSTPAGCNPLMMLRMVLSLPAASIA